MTGDEPETETEIYKIKRPSPGRWGKLGPICECFTAGVEMYYVFLCLGSSPRTQDFPMFAPYIWFSNRSNLSI